MGETDKSIFIIHHSMAKNYVIRTKSKAPKKGCIKGRERRNGSSDSPKIFFGLNLEM